EDLLLETRVVLAHHRNLQLLSRTEMRKDARFAHVHEVGQRADGQPLEAVLRGKGQGGIDDGGLGLLALRLGFDPAGGGIAHGGERGRCRPKETNGRAILAEIWPGAPFPCRIAVFFWGSRRRPCPCWAPAVCAAGTRCVERRTPCSAGQRGRPQVARG